MSDYEVVGLYQSESLINHFALFSDCDPNTSENAIKESKWCKAMNGEIAVIEKKNQT